MDGDITVLRCRNRCLYIKAAASDVDALVF